MRKFLLALWFASSPGVLFGQTNDHFWRSWSWSEAVGSARDAGLAGATVALADDATLANPAGLGTLTKIELSASLLNWGSGSFAGRDGLSSRTSVGFVGGGGLITERWAIGGYISQPRDSLITLAPVALGPGASDAGRLEATITDVAGGVAWSPLSHVHVGVRVNATHLKLSGEWDRTLGGVQDLRAGTAAGSTKVIPSAGVLYDVSHTVRLGLVATPGVSWSASRTAQNPLLGITLDPGSIYEVRVPTTIRGGIAVRANEHVILVGEADYVRYSEIRDHLSITQGTSSRAQYDLSDGVEARGGVEVSLPVGTASVQFRGGLMSRAAGAVSFTGPDPIERAAFPGNARQTQATAGLSVATKAGVRLDGAATFGGDQRAFAGGLAVRF
jgi:hypothetical protein